ncbi:helix-turn-helix domain-containing protein [Aquimarina sp. 2304DJ70-9]|uniref:helix-turn-helix domain-containing protein n=1 Tax=Aquimarina penaris TaxID=3231044 RepID=UPI003462954E
MILKQRHMELGGKAVISHFTFRPPLVAAADMTNEACFIFPIQTQGNLYRVDGKTQVGKNQAVLMKCGTYVNKWHGITQDQVAEVVILRLFPEIIQSAINADIGSKIQERLNKERTTAVIQLDVLLKKFLEGLFFYFDNPTLVTDELVMLKIKELTLLLLNAKDSDPIIELLNNLFNKELYTLKEIVDANLFENLTLVELASLAKMSISTFKRKFKELIGDTPGRYIKNKRMQQATYLLANTSKRVSTIAYECGYSDPGYFAKTFRKEYELSPKDYRNIRA